MRNGRVHRLDWRAEVRGAVRAYLSDYVETRCCTALGEARVGIAGDVLAEFIDGGKYVRSTFMYLGWRCGADEDAAALRACASLELLHAFALMQDDVMDESALRRGRASTHLQFGSWHRRRGLTGSADRFGESAATLLGDLCLVWSGTMLRDSGISADALARVQPRFDEMCIELAVGQFADLVNDASALPALEQVLDVLRRKSGNYTVRRPLEIGAVMAGCAPAVVDAVGGYGAAIGEAFQLRDDILGVFGSPAQTGKDVGTDLVEQKATSVVVAAHQLADATTRAELTALMRSPALRTGDVERWQTLIASTGALRWIEELIDERLVRARACLRRVDLPPEVREALDDMAVACTERAA